MVVLVDGVVLVVMGVWIAEGDFTAQAPMLQKLIG